MGGVRDLRGAARLSLAALGGRGTSLLPREPLSCVSQVEVEVAGRLGVDRTALAVLVDGLEDRGLVERRSSVQERGKNIVQLTTAGRDRLHRRTRRVTTWSAVSWPRSGRKPRAPS